MQIDVKNLKKWFLNQKRDLPWRETKDPYAIWVSEIMLQQTQVAVVIPYFLNWMKIFPTIEKLALSSSDTVIKAWEGLGYYSRARNLHEGARYVLENHEGKLPSSAEELRKIKGIGPYTVGAILSFAFQKKKAAVDGNVIRVLTRLFAIEEDISKPKTVKAIWNIAEAILPDEHPWVVSEALIELGATICTKKSKCHLCPLKTSCKAFLHGKVDDLPFKSAKVKIEKIIRHVSIIIAENKLLVRRAKKDEIMSGLYEFPFVESNSHDPECFDFPLKKVMEFRTVNHSYTRFRVRLNPILYTAEKIHHVLDHEWLSVEELEQFAFSSGHRRLFQAYKAL